MISKQGIPKDRGQAPEVSRAGKNLQPKMEWRSEELQNGLLRAAYLRTLQHWCQPNFYFADFPTAVKDFLAPGFIQFQFRDCLAAAIL